MRMIRLSAVSSAARVTRNSIAPVSLIVPAHTSSPGSLRTGADSPVIGA